MSAPAGRVGADAADGYETVACDSCGGADSLVRYRLDRTCLVSCRACGLTFVNPRRHRHVLDQRLQQWAVNDTLDPDRLAIAFEPATMRLYARHVRGLGRALGGPGRLLDVGCATGAFLSAGREQGWAVEGLELGEASARYAREVRGLPVTCRSLYEHDPGAVRYDAIACLEVIEHLPSPLAALRRLHGWLRPGGVLLLSTPNFDALYRRLFGTRWWVINCEDEHIVLFTAATLSRILDQAGFTIVDRRSRSIDHAGLLSQLRVRRAVADPPEVGGGYYAARDRKSGLKRWLARGGLLRAARGALAAQDWLLARPFVPSVGEQLLVLARRREPGGAA